jgi:epoxyqueuosine reductase
VLEVQLKEQARALGFELAGIAAAGPADHFDRYLEWLDRGYAGEMAYLADRPALRHSPTSVLPSVQSVLMLGMSYNAIDASSPTARIARYAQGPDYHQTIWAKLNDLLEWLRERAPQCEGRGVVDTAPLLERDFARRAGLGWFGKNTLLINKERGSYLFLAALLLNLKLAPDTPHESSHCGTCSACLDACPTQAFAGPGWLDARKCVSYLTIELRQPIPEELRPGVGAWLFGCDICQEVCPWNRKPGRKSGVERAGFAALDPRELLRMDERQFRERFRGTPFARPKRSGLLRDAALVIGNTGDLADLPALEQAARDHDPLIQDAARWAITRVRERAATEA